MKVRPRFQSSLQAGPLAGTKKAFEGDEFNNDLNKKIDDICKILNTSLNDRVTANDYLVKNKSYAEATGEVIIVKPKKAQKSKVTKEVVKKP